MGTIRKILRGALRTGKTINEMNEKKKTENPKPETQSSQTGLTSKELNIIEFRHTEKQQLCQFVNTEKLDVLTIAHDGNKYVVFYWETVLND